MILKVLEGFQAAPGSSRSAGSIGEVRFEIQIDYTSQKPLRTKVAIYIPSGRKTWKKSLKILESIEP